MDNLEMDNLLKVGLGVLIFLLIFMSALLVGNITKEINGEQGYKIVPCYDRWNSEIKDQQCIKKVYDYGLFNFMWKNSITNNKNYIKNDNGKY